jgi:hypothetical protein
MKRCWKNDGKTKAAKSPASCNRIFPTLAVRDPPFPGNADVPVGSTEKEADEDVSAPSSPKT